MVFANDNRICKEKSDNHLGEPKSTSIPGSSCFEAKIIQKEKVTVNLSSGFNKVYYNSQL